MADRNVNIWISLKNIKGAVSSLKSLGGGFLSIGRQARASLSSIGGSILNLKNLVLGGLVYGAFRMLKSAVTDVVGEYQKQEAASQLLQTNLQSQGNWSKYVTDRLAEQATALQNLTRFGDEQITQGQAVLASYGASGAMIERMTPIVVNFAEATGQDLGSAFELAGKASVGYTAMLSRYGIIIDENIPKSQKFEAALEAMAKRGGKAAEDRAKTSLGAWQQLGNLWGEIKEKIGGFIVTSKPLGDLFGKLKGALADVNAWLETNSGTIQKLTDEGMKILAEAVLDTWHKIQSWAQDGTFFAWLEFGMNAVKALHGAFVGLRGAGGMLFEFARWSMAKALKDALGVAEAVLTVWNTITGKGQEALDDVRQWRQAYKEEVEYAAEDTREAATQTYEKLADIGSSMNATSDQIKRWQETIAEAQNRVTDAKKKTAEAEKGIWEGAKKTLEVTKEQKDALQDFALMSRMKQMAVVSLLQRRKEMTPEQLQQLPGEAQELITGYKPLREAYGPVLEAAAKERLKAAGVSEFAGLDLAAMTPEKVEATAKVEVYIHAGEDIAAKAGEAAGVKMDELLDEVQNVVSRSVEDRRRAARTAAVALRQAG